MKKIPGFIQWVSSSNANRDFPVLVFSADVDFATSGMVSLTSAERHEVVGTLTTADEWNQYDPKVIEDRVNRLLSRTDLRCVALLRTEGSRLVYSDLFCEGGEAFSRHTQSLKEFGKSGGIVTCFQFCE